MRILICDDDTLIIEQLQKYIESYFESNHLKCPELVSFTSGESLLADKNEKDIVFLDIEMPGMNGIFVGNELKKANKNVIIFVVTSYSEYLDEAMRFHVFRYLSKPLDKQRFFRNMKDALTYYNSITTKIPVETKQGVYSFPASQIIAIEAQGRKVIVHTARQEFMSMIIIKGEFSFFSTVSSIKESGMLSADSTALSNKLQNNDVKSCW